MQSVSDAFHTHHAMISSLFDVFLCPRGEVLLAEQVAKTGLCAGCGLCAGISRSGAIRMETSESGFRRPREVAPVPEAEEELVRAACPGLRVVLERDDEVNHHPVWGPIAELGFCWSSDADLRHRASSGGALSEFLAFLLASGEVDYVVQVDTSESSPLRHDVRVNTSRAHVVRAAGSKYAPTSPLERIGEYLERPGRFAFVGKPCDIAALRQLGRVDLRVGSKVGVMIAFMCGGVPSYGGTLAMLRAMGVDDPEDVVEFRYRGFGWPGRATAMLSDGSEKSLDYDQAWGGILSKAVQFRCKICADGTGELADITFADGWHLGPDNKPIFEERVGRSMVMVRTELAKNLFAKAVATGCIQTQPLPLEELVLIQPHQAARKASVASRLAAMDTLRLPRTRYHNLNLGRLALRRGLVLNLRNYLGMLRRLLLRTHNKSR